MWLVNALFDPGALGVEQIGDAVLSHHGLAGAGSALDHQHAGVIEADDLVLLGLDRRDDVAHAVAARRVDRGEQGRITAERALVAGVGVGAAEYLVGEIEQTTSSRVELAPPAHPLRAGGGGDVERAGGRCPPVEQQRFMVVALVEDADATDVEPLTGECVQPSETQAVIGDVQPRDRCGQRTHIGVAGDERSAVLNVDRALQRGSVLVLDALALGIEPVVESGQVTPLGLEFTIVCIRRHTPRFDRSICECAG